MRRMGRARKATGGSAVDTMAAAMQAYATQGSNPGPADRTHACHTDVWLASLRTG